MGNPHRALPFAVALSFFPALRLVSSQWVDPSFEEMAKSSELIAVVEVLEGGAFEARVKAVEVLKGTDPGTPFRVVGFNNHNWPPEDVKEESLSKGDRLLAFLRKDDEDEKERDGSTFSVPTPSTGDFPIRDGELHGNWCFPSYPLSDPGLDASLAITVKPVPNRLVGCANGGSGLGDTNFLRSRRLKWHREYPHMGLIYNLTHMGKSSRCHGRRVQRP